jgi:hypothetical protein
MVKHWSLQVEGRPAQVVVDWDVVALGSGRIRVNGELLTEWGMGLKFPGVTHTLRLASQDISFVYTFVNFDIDLSRAPGVVSINPPLPVQYAPNVRRSVMKVVALLAAVLAIPILIIVGITVVPLLLRP